MIASGEIGVGGVIAEKWQVGGRFHATMQKTIADVATAFNDEDPAVDDIYIASTFGVDAMFGMQAGVVTPYLALGFTDVSTFFFIGDDAYVGNNLHPYAGPVGSLGADLLLNERWRFAGEFYAAPGGYSLPDKSVESVKPGSRYGSLYTGRIRLAIEL